MTRAKSAAIKNAGMKKSADFPTLFTQDAEAAQPVVEVPVSPAKKDVVAAGKMPKPRKAHRFRPGTVALREIRRYQKSTENLVPFTRISNLVRELIRQHTYGKDVCVQKGVVALLRDTGEEFISRVFAEAQLQAIHAKRITVTVPDMRMATRTVNFQVDTKN
jgi:histone H3